MIAHLLAEAVNLFTKPARTVVSDRRSVVADADKFTFCYILGHPASE
ncbi:hypothetical protein [Scytonema millei]|uniref:Uncharacterized protein n=1 Tax=Scytonema millei VB511283 TaxID=1245923 RepID=A0A9X5E7L2_9CYAN|nr:hypothetical protein [Scytonema millei]NHC36805.1 hypothetical protein [Scytonema millei VB511283]